MNATLNVLVAYEDLAAEGRAKDLLSRLSVSLAPRVKLKLALWKFTVLSIPPLQDLALDDAREADVIIVSSTHQNQMATELTTWVDRWEPRPAGHTSALVALAGAPGGDEVASLPPVITYCRRVARKHGMDFFSDSKAPESERALSLLPSRLPLGARPPAPFAPSMPDEALFSQTTDGSLPVNGQCSSKGFVAA